jgi:hypothetical protein
MALLLFQVSGARTIARGNNPLPRPVRSLGGIGDALPPAVCLVEANHAGNDGAVELAAIGLAAAEFTPVFAGLKGVHTAAGERVLRAQFWIVPES